MTVIQKRPSTAGTCVCVEKSGTFQFRISGVHHSLAKQDKFNATSYHNPKPAVFPEPLPSNGYKTKRSPLIIKYRIINYITDRQLVYCAERSD
jgi:hypothetical protein